MTRSMARRGLAILALIGSFAHPPPAQSQEAPPADSVEQVAETTPTEIVAAARADQDSVLTKAVQIEDLADVEDIREELNAAAERQQELFGVLNAFRAVESIRPERLLHLRDLALVNQQRLEEISEELRSRLDELGNLRAGLLGRRSNLSDFQSANPDTQVPEVAPAMEAIDSLLANIEAVQPTLAEIDSELEGRLSGARDLVSTVADLRAGRRAALLRADEPILLSPRHLAQLRGSWEWRPSESLRPEAIDAFVRGHSELLLLHLLAILLLGITARKLRALTIPEDGWSGLLRQPWAFAVFGATVVLGRRYLLAPPIWDVVSWTLLAASGAALASALLRGRNIRIMIVSVAAVYPLLLLAEALLMPVPLLRLAIAGAAALALIAFPLLARRVDVSNARGRRARIALILASALSAAILVAEFLGLDQLARWLVHATLTSAYVVLAVAFLVVIFRGALGTLLRKEYMGRIRLIGILAIPLAERLVAILQVILIIAGALVLLDVWEIAPAPIETWRVFVGWGFEVGGLRITVGRLLIALVLIYLAVVASWFGRTLLYDQVERGWTLDRGVLDSINMLVHYALVTLGILLGLGALGLELQNFAIIAGALGVGIGFGLQNVVNNFASGLILLFERPVRVGDTVEIDEEWGTIKKIGLRSTVVVTFTRAELIVPNGDLVSQKVTNWTLSDPVTRLALPVGAAYGSDVQKVLRVLVEAALAHPAVVSTPPPLALFHGFGDSSLDFELFIWIDSIPQRLIAKSSVLTEIDRRFREEGIEIPFPQRDLHIRSVDAGAAEVFKPRERGSPTTEPERDEG